MANYARRCFISFMCFASITPFILHARDATAQVSAANETVEKSDTRTPFERYQGAYLGAWLLCAITQKNVYLVEQAQSKGVTLDKATTDSDVSKCIANGLSEMKKEYANILPLVANEAGKKALLDHYVAAILHVKQTHPYGGEDEAKYMKRMNATKEKTDELWVRFEITQP